MSLRRAGTKVVSAGLKGKIKLTPTEIVYKGKRYPREGARAEFTDVVEVSIMAAISAAEKQRTSKSSSAARWLPGRCCRAATKAS